VVIVAFQIAFRAEIHANDFFHFLKIIFDTSTSKRSKKYKPHSILAKKKKFKIWSKAGSTAEPNLTCQERIGLRPTQIAIWLKKINVATILTIN
jgi:hypothetical protein